MHKTTYITTIIFMLVLFSCKQSCLSKISTKTNISEIVLDTIMYNNYLKAIENENTIEYFLVIKVKNLNNGEIKEVCTNGNFLDGALYKEYKIGYDSASTVIINNIKRKNKKRYFEFKDTSALNNIGFNNYSTNDFIEFEKHHQIDSLAQILKKGEWSLAISDNKTMLFYAHALFNRGILTGENSCFGGTLIHIDNELLNQ